MKNIVFSLICMACGPAHGPEMPQEMTATDNPNAYFEKWVVDYHEEIPPKMLELIDVIYQKAEADYPGAAVKIASNLGKMQYFTESDSFPVKADGSRTMGTCYSQGERPIGIDILSREGFEPFNKDFFGGYATDATLDAIQELVTLHELGHCAGGLKHSSTSGILVMSAYVSWQNVSKFLADKDLYIGELVMSIDRGSAGLWLDDVDDDDHIDMDEE